MSRRISAWAVYDVFSVQGDEQIFLAAVSDCQWVQMCGDLGWADLLADPRLASNNSRVLARSWRPPLLRQRLAAFSAAELGARFDAIGLPYAPITRPQDLFDDPHLRATGDLAPLAVPADASSAGQAFDTHVALLALTIDGQRLPVRRPPPALGTDADALLRELGYGADDVAALRAAGVVAVPQETPADPAATPAT